MISMALDAILSHKEVKEKMLEEITQVFADDLKRPMTHEDYEKLEYCQAVFDEFLRYQALIPFVVRKTTADGADVCGYLWPKDTIVLINTDVIHRNPKYWGDDADQFKPERCLKNQMDKIDKHAYGTFGGGLRVCPGRHIAKTLVVSLLV